MLEYLTGGIEKPTVKEEGKPKPSTGKSDSQTTWWGAANPTLDEWQQWDVYAQSMIILNIINSIGAGVKFDGMAAEAWGSLTKLHDAKSDLSLLQAEEELNSIKY